jgi:hypothetical protein
MKYRFVFRQSHPASVPNWQIELTIPDTVGNQAPNIVGKDVLHILIGHL